MRPLQEIEDAITAKLAEIENTDMYDLWTEYLGAKNRGLVRLVEGMEKKDPVIIGAVIGAAIGHLFTKDETPTK